MKFSEIQQEQWSEFASYFDTCLIPVTGLKGGESPVAATLELEKLRDLLDVVEIPFKGRVVTYPAFHYVGDEQWTSLLVNVCESLRTQGFRYIVLMCANPSLAPSLQRIGADLCFVCSVEELNARATEWRSEVHQSLQTLWSSTPAS